MSRRPITFPVALARRCCLNFSLLSSASPYARVFFFFSVSWLSLPGSSALCLPRNCHSLRNLLISDFRSRLVPHRHRPPSTVCASLIGPPGTPLLNRFFVELSNGGFQAPEDFFLIFFFWSHTVPRDSLPGFWNSLLPSPPSIFDVLLSSEVVFRLLLTAAPYGETFSNVRRC